MKRQHFFALICFVGATFFFITDACEKKQMRKVDFLLKQKTPPSSCIVEKDTIHLGWFDSPFEHPDVRVGIHRCSWRQKQYQFLSMVSDRYIVGITTADVGYLSNFFVYIFDFQTQKYVEFEDMGFTGRRSSIAKNSLAGTSGYRSKKCSMKIENRYAEGYYLLDFNCSDKNNHVSGKVTIHTQGDPIVNIREVAPERMVYTHQSACYRPEGTVTLNGETITFDPKKDYSAFDYTQGRHLYRTEWNWASGGGYTSSGSPIGITFSTGTGMFYWVNDTLYRTAQLSFNYTNVDSLWQLISLDSLIALEFEPCGKRVGNTNVLGLLVSKFIQPFGMFRGTIRTPDGRVFTASFKGVTEEHIAKW